MPLVYGAHFLDRLGETICHEGGLMQAGKKAEMWTYDVRLAYYGVSRFSALSCASQRKRNRLDC